MWVDVKTIAAAVGKSPRTIQLMAKDGKIVSRRVGKKALEIYVPSLSPEWQVKVGGSQKAMISTTKDLTALALPAQLKTITTDKSTALALTSKLSDKDRERLLIANKIKQRPAGTTKVKWLKTVARFYGVSTSTVRRIADDVNRYGVVGKPRKTPRNSVWDSEAIQFMKGFYLQAIRETGDCSKTTAWNRTQMMAKEKRWKIGSRSSAFQILSEISHLMVAYARGGNRALDNYFYANRNCKLLRPMQIIIGDQHIFDHWIADYDTGLIRRPECYLWLDMGTKLIYGIAFDVHYSSDTVKEALRLGLYRFGRFECTYNDNGSSECSQAITSMVDDLLKLDMHCDDVSELWKTPEGVYVIEDEEGNVLETAINQQDWRRQHRRIYANVKNAKAKDIERFFRTLNERLDARMLPGRCATPGANAAIDEVERARLEKQKNNHELLTEIEFIQVVLEELSDYENAKHSTLGMSPLQWLDKKVEEGWKPRQIDEQAIELIVSDRCQRKVQRGRVEINNIWYWGEEQTATNGELDDVGLWNYNDQKVDIRYNRHDPSHAYAIVNGSIRYLEPVKALVMLDDDAMKDAIATKRRQMKAVRDAFGTLTKPIGSVLYKPHREHIRQIQPEDYVEESDEKLQAAVVAQIEDSRAIGKNIPFLPMHASDYDRYRWCQDMLIRGLELSEKDLNFMGTYEKTNEYKDNHTYWDMYRKLGGIDK
nr:transposase [uncultured Sphaerochaeta sp.]